MLSLQPIFIKRTLSTLAAAASVALFAGSISLAGAQTQPNNAKQQSAIAAKPKTAASAASQIKVTKDQIESAKTLGSKGAPITFEVFSDFQCPMCRSFFLSTSHKLLEDYCSAGKVYLVHHDYPKVVPSHIYSEEAARWANAAAVIGKFHEVEAALYSDQDSWAATGKVEESVAKVLAPADMKRIRALLNNPEVAAAIKQDHDLGDSNRIGGTPTLYVTHNGHRDELSAVGLTPNLLKSYMDSLLQH
jgi:protein-disulfide isomerase